jgi:TRAP-type C4-dicarboxylate transport system permease small subunit
MMTRWINRICNVFEVVIALFLALMVVLVFGNVVLRYGFNSSISMSDEVSRWLFVWVTFLGAVVALQRHEHLGVDMVVDRLPVLGKKICLVLGHGVMLAVTWWLLDGSWVQVKLNMEVSAPSTGLPMAILYAPGAIFALMAGFILLTNLWLALTGQLSKADLVMVQASEEAAQLEEILGAAQQVQNDARPGGAIK